MAIVVPVGKMMELREKHEMSNREIAEELGISVMSVQKYIGKQPEWLTQKKKIEGAAKARARKIERAEQIAKRVLSKPVEEKPVEPAPVAEPPKKPVISAPSEPSVAVKRRITLRADLFEHAYIGEWDSTLADLSQMTHPEPWGFKDPKVETRLPEYVILNHYLRHQFKMTAINYNNSQDDAERDQYFHVRNNLCAFNTGLQTPWFKDIYMLFIRNPRQDTTLPWKFLKFDTEKANEFRFVNDLPVPCATRLVPDSRFNPQREIRINVEHILSDTTNYERLPESIRDSWNLSLALETAIELSRRKSVTMPSLVVEAIFAGKFQYLLPLYMTNERTPDLALTLELSGECYIGHTCLTPQMAYTVARNVGQPTVKWLTELVE